MWYDALMAKSFDIVEFVPSDGLTPLQVQKLNWNFRKVANLVGQVDVDQGDAVKGLVVKTVDLAADQKMTVSKSGTRSRTVLSFGIPAAQTRITAAQVDSVLANDDPTGDGVLNLTGLSRFWAGVRSAIADISTTLVTGVKGDAEQSYRRGNVNLTPSNIGAAPASHLHDAGNIQSGVLALARGGTGVDASAQYGYKVFGSTNNGLPYFRDLIPDEIPTLGTNKIDGIWPVTKGGTGVDSRNTAKNRFFASPYGSAGDPTFRAIHSSDIPQLSPTKSGFQGGSIAVSSVSAGSGADSAITFTPSFNSTPIVIVGMTSSQTAYTGQCSAYAMNVSSSGFTLRRQNNYTSARNIGAYWIAFEI